MRHFIISLIAIMSAISLSSCNDTWQSSYDSSYDTVYPGMVAYSYANHANTLSIDGVSVAMRLAVLLKELEAANMEISEGETDVLVSTIDGSTKSWDDLDRFEFWSSQTDKRNFLFGDTRDISISRGKDSENEFYTITYDKDGTNGHIAATLDINYRSGAYIIDTQGVQLEESSKAEPWSIYTSSENPIIFGDEGSFEIGAECVYYAAYVWYNEGGSFLFDLTTTLNTRLEGAWDATWGTGDESGELLFDSYKELTFESLAGNSFEFMISTSGTTIYGYDMKFVVTDPIVYNYSQSPYAAIAGAVEVTNLSDFSTVQMEREFSEGYLFNDTYTYEGESYVDTYYYWLN